MIKRQSEHRFELRERARGGKGIVELHHLLEPEQMFMNGRLLATAELQPGCSLGYHTHIDEMEFFYILSGAARVDDNGDTTILYPGDTMYTGDGEGHSIETFGDTPLKYIAVIIKKAKPFDENIPQ